MLGIFGYIRAQRNYSILLRIRKGFELPWETRLVVYTLMKQNLGFDSNYGFCYALSLALRDKNLEREMDEYYRKHAGVLERIRPNCEFFPFPEVDCYRPDDFDMYWFRLGYFGTLKRIRILRRAIKTCKDNIAIESKNKNRDKDGHTEA